MNKVVNWASNILVVFILLGCASLDCGISIKRENKQYIVEDGWCEIKQPEDADDK